MPNSMNAAYLETDIFDSESLEKKWETSGKLGGLGLCLWLLES